MDDNLEPPLAVPRRSVGSAHTELVLPTKEQVAAATAAMRKAHESWGYIRPLKDQYIETMFWAGFFANFLNGQSGADEKENP